MFAGILLGPSFLGWLAPGVSAYLFPPNSLGFLNALSQVGVMIFMFLVGLGINPKELKDHGHAAVLTSHVSITAPFVLAAFLSLYLYPKLSDDSVAFSSFALFMGAAMSITAFPVLGAHSHRERSSRKPAGHYRDCLRGCGRRDWLVHSRLHRASDPIGTQRKSNLAYRGRPAGLCALHDLRCPPLVTAISDDLRAEGRID